MKYFCRDQSVSLLRQTLAANACTASFANPRGTVQSMPIVCKAMPGFANRARRQLASCTPRIVRRPGIHQPVHRCDSRSISAIWDRKSPPSWQSRTACKSGNASSREKCPLMAACDGFAKNQPLMRLQNRPSLPRAFAKAS